MPQYQFANKDGEIVSEEYDRTTTLSAEQVKESMVDAFGTFPFAVTVNQSEDLNDVFHVQFDENADLPDLYICAKGMTPGGRNALKDEQRIQPKAKALNYVYAKGREGKLAVFLGVYCRDNELILCTWKQMASNASSEDMPISKQIKITTIAKAAREGFAQQDKGGGEYACAFRQAFLYFYLRNCTWLHTGHVSKLAEHTVPEPTVSSDEAAEDGLKGIDLYTGIEAEYPRNRIIFGAPGTGKSYQLKEDCHKLLAETSGEYERVTFHPDYTFSQFVGTYKPATDVDGKIVYAFVPGPFMRVYVKALKSALCHNPQPYLLIVEEINRAKVAAVFGDVFQLLDRDDLGVSEYEIEASEDIKKYLARELGGSAENYSQIKIPDNMFIWATMNSADQGVFPMDTAFKRRWNFEYLGINANESKLRGRTILGASVTQNVEWNILRKAINEKLAKEYKVNEDKLMGPFFIAKKELATVGDNDDTIADAGRFMETFKSKVIMYLYEDAAKQHKHKLFSGCEDTTKYSAVCDRFDQIGMCIFGDEFEEVYYNSKKG